MLEQTVEYLGTTKFRFTTVLCMILIMIMIFTKPGHDLANNCSREKIDAQITQIVKEKERSLYEKMWLSCKNGMIKGGVTGSITGGVVGAVSGGAVFGIVNPLILYINES